MEKNTAEGKRVDNGNDAVDMGSEHVPETLASAKESRTVRVVGTVGPYGCFEQGRKEGKVLKVSRRRRRSLEGWRSHL